MKYEVLNEVFSPKYVCKNDDEWYLITNSSFLKLKEPVQNSPFVLQLNEINDIWSPPKPKNYSLVLAQSLARQLYRLPDNSVLINNNLIAMKQNEKIRIFWTIVKNIDKDEIDAPRILVLVDIFDIYENPQVAEWHRHNIIKQLENNLKEFTNFNENKTKDIDKDLYESNLVFLERNFFDVKYFELLKNNTVKRIEQILKEKSK